MLELLTENDIKKDTIERLVWAGALVIRINSGAVGGEYTDRQGKIKKRFLRFARWFGLGVTKEDGQAGISDVIALYRGVTVAVETKRPGLAGNVSDSQRRFLDEWQAHGGVAWVISEPGEVDAVITEIDRRLA